MLEGTTGEGVQLAGPVADGGHATSGMGERPGSQPSKPSALSGRPEDPRSRNYSLRGDQVNSNIAVVKRVWAPDRTLYKRLFVLMAVVRGRGYRR